ncbi:M61 family metallopeptidase [Cyanobium sp. T1B-Tous]|uniref:M61 family metallopeptidase n=1 Tax=Cyanobium sp. T1B-Tous TaxID=2823721 RepID=UPI0020CBEBCA|nr:M61 family peptidase [Cyanobium sp. T1B-Tous]MCP9805398.1 M61 family metallopeptidase [Cyanobium sp. T1B-Tous]
MPAFHLDLTACHQHLVRVRLSHTPTRPSLGFTLPGWTPGSYLIRDYVRQLEGLTVVQAGQSLEPRRLTPSRWQLELPTLEPLEISYTLLAADLTVRTCHLNGDHGFLALAAVLLELDGERWSPHALQLNLPPDWQAFVPLPPPDRAGSEGWVAATFDQLVDTPIEVGPHRSHPFQVAGVPHRWVTWGADLAGVDPLESDPLWLTDLEQVCLACCRLMGVERPAAPHYLFVLHLTDSGYGGLEHDLSTVLQFGRRALARPAGRRKLLQLAAHEYLHQWNVRRLRPAELTPYRYDQAVVVPTLWFAEGITSYVDQLLPHSAGCCTEAEVLEDLGADLSRYLLSPGRQVQSLRASSEEAWVKLYQPDAHSPNSQISYYLKGAVLALVLDLHLRRAGSGLPRVLRELWASHGAVGRGYREADLIEAFARQAPDLAERLPRWLDSCEDPPLQACLADVGLRLQPKLGRSQHLGCRLEAGADGVTLARVAREGPAVRAGLAVGDEWIALNGVRLRGVDDCMELFQPEAPLTAHQLLFCRDGLVRSTTLLPEPPSVESWRLEIVPETAVATAPQRRRWLTLEAP